jgi:hypothetical protein
MINGSFRIGRSGLTKKELLVTWHSNLRPLLLIRKLIRKFWYEGFSCKEYLICFNIISSNFKRWEEEQVLSCLFGLFLVSDNRKIINSWEQTIKPGRKLFSDLMRRTRKNGVEQSEILERFAFTQRFLTVPKLEKKELNLKVVDLPSNFVRAARRIGVSPSSFGSNSKRTMSSQLNLGEISSILPPRELIRLIEQLFKLLDREYGIPRDLRYRVVP